MDYAQTSVLTFEPCVLQENTLNFELQDGLQKNCMSYSNLLETLIRRLEMNDLAKYTL